MTDYYSFDRDEYGIQDRKGVDATDSLITKLTVLLSVLKTWREKALEQYGRRNTEEEVIVFWIYNKDYVALNKFFVAAAFK